MVRAALEAPAIRAVCAPLVVGPRGAGVPVDESVGEWSPALSRGDAGRLAAHAVERAARLALNGEVQGIVTAPLDKSALLEAGIEHPGHTEMLAALTASRVAMMLASERLRVVLVTTHVPLRSVPDAVTRDGIVEAAMLARRGLRDWFGIAEARLVLCALNPHAGDGGRFGREDDEVLAPAARVAGIAGPLPADTVFVRAMRGEFDAVLAPYHDVGMTAIKVASFGSAVNVTLGLPFPRCSPDHGTALDIAGRGLADPSSFIAATLLCARIVRRTTEAHAPPTR